MESRFGCFEIRTSCTQCGNPLVLNGPQLKPKCDSCLQVVDVPAGIWKGWLENLLDDYGELDWKHGASSTIMSGEFTAKVNYYRLKPRCPECKEDLGVDVESGTDEILHCLKCGKGSLDTFPAPEWLRNILPANQVYGAEREVEKRSEMEAAPKPIVMACPQCGGTLKATAESERIMPCAYCNVDVYLPDAVWRKLHPARTIQEWFIRFKPKAQPARIEEPDEDSDPRIAEPLPAPPVAPPKKNPEKRELELQAGQARKTALWLALIGVLLTGASVSFLITDSRPGLYSLFIGLSAAVFLGVAVERWFAANRKSAAS